MKPVIAFVTYQKHPAILPDDELAAQALRRAGANVQAVVWDDDGADWAAFDLAILRSPWDYFMKPARFAAWLDDLERSGARVLNAVPIARWNSHKTYLRALEAAGIRIAPTVWIERGAQADAAALALERGWRDVILKPAFSAGAFRTARLAASGAAALNGLLAEITAESDAMLQPFLSEIAERGELSLIFFNDGENAVFSHAVLKTPGAGDFRVQEEYGGSTRAIMPATPLVGQARAALEASLRIAPCEWLYARVDGVELDGAFTLVEIELIEPALFFAFDAEAPERFARAVMRFLRDAPAR